MVTTTLKLRADLQSAEVVDADGVLYYDVTDPKTGGVLRLFDYEWLIAQKLDGQRGFDELARWTEDPPTVAPHALAEVRRHAVRTLLDLLGPAAEPLCVRIEAAGDWAAFVESVKRVRESVRGMRGPEAANRYTESIERFIEGRS